MPDSKDPMLKMGDVAEMLGCSYGTAIRMAQKGELPMFKMGQNWRVRTSKLNEWIEAQEAKAQK